MNKTYMILFVLYTVLSGCEIQNEKGSDKEQITQKLEALQKNLDEKIASLKEQSKITDYQVIEDLEKSIKGLEKERKKIKRSIRKAANATKDEIKSIEKEAAAIEDDIKIVQKEISDVLEKFKKQNK